MNFEFFLNSLEIEEPQGFADIVLLMKRDDNWHGIFFEASTSDLIFYGAAADYLRSQKRQYGIEANVTFKAYESCAEGDTPTLVYQGKLNFGKYVESCGSFCYVTIPVEQTGCLMTMRNRYDQKVDMDSSVAFDKLTAIQVYDRMGFQMELPAQNLEVGLVASRGTDTPFHLFVGGAAGIDTTIVRPTYNSATQDSLITGNPIPTFDYSSTIDSEAGINMTPQLLWENGFECFPRAFPVVEPAVIVPYSFRLKGDFTVSRPSGGNYQLISVILKIERWNGEGDIFTDGDLLDSFNTGEGSGGFVNSKSGTFDTTFTGNAVLATGDGLYAYVEFITDKGGIPGDLDFVVNFDEETNVEIRVTKSCPPTEADVYMVNECLSHAAEAITDSCLKVKSDYYGRTDSQPYASTDDGCGSLRILTSGLFIRQAENPKFFASLKDLFDGLRAIDNIGMGIETNPYLPNAEWLRIEQVEYFYQDSEIMALPYIPDAKKSIQENLHYSLIKVGYKKWEVENVNGLDEFNSNKEFRTGLTTINNTLDITSGFIAGGYAWEITRQQSSAATGAADNKYDNDTFIACVERDAYGFHVEQGNIEDAANIFSPSTAYNWRIRPFYNLMRWFKSIVNSYANIVNTTSKLFFSSGTGNINATGEIAGAYPTCKLENSEKAENQDLHRTDFADTAEAIPIWAPEYITFKYPLSVKEYMALKANPYGYLSVQCGKDGYQKAFIQEIRYRLVDGQADFSLKMKYGN